MRSVSSTLIQGLISLPRYTKRTFIVVADLIVFSLVLWLMLSARYGELYVPESWGALLLVLLAPVITAATFGWFGLYRLVTRFIGYRGTWRMVVCALLAGLIWALIAFLTGQLGMPRTVVFAYGPMTALAAVATRQVAGFLLRRAGVWVPSLPVDGGRNVLVYSAGPTAAKLVEELTTGGMWNVVAIIDPMPSMRGQYIHGVRVDLPHRLAGIVSRSNVDQVFVALEGYRRAERSAALQLLSNLPVKVRIVPDTAEIAAGRVAVDALRPVQASDLLGRQRVAPITELLNRAVRGKSVLITGAGGSIGSELARQTLRHSPRRLVLLDASEPALYDVEAEMRSLVSSTDGATAIEIISILGSVRDHTVVTGTLTRHGVDIVYHAAAYKHVPIVEHNPLVALANNVLGTATVARAAQAIGVERFVLISSDKAVRPTSVMGASKRLAELVIQALAADKPAARRPTVFSAVRFGNVLDSSGSVVRKFRQQIRAGGPVTVTDPNVTRYFMSIEEAAELVIQASAMAKGGEVFLLDMGEPVRIDDLAKLMICHSGLTFRSPANPLGDIEITYIGLKPGEKLYEELLIGNDPCGTEHPRILRTIEHGLTLTQVDAELDRLADALMEFDTRAALEILSRTVPEYTPDEKTLRSVEGPATRPRSIVLH